MWKFCNSCNLSFTLNCSMRDSLRNELQKHVMLRRKKSDVLKELKDKVRYKEVIASDTDYYLEELDKIWKKLEEDKTP